MTTKTRGLTLMRKEGTMEVEVENVYNVQTRRWEQKEQIPIDELKYQAAVQLRDVVLERWPGYSKILHIHDGELYMNKFLLGDEDKFYKVEHFNDYGFKTEDGDCGEVIYSSADIGLEVDASGVPIIPGLG